MNLTLYDNILKIKDNAEDVNISVFGPTASGKTSLAIDLAFELSSNIFNADSKQIYKSFNILSAMPTKDEFAKAPHFLFEFLDPTQKYSAEQYLKDVKSKLTEVNTNKQNIFVGGTGFYLKALEEGFSLIPKSDELVINELSKLSTSELYNKLKQVDPLRASQVYENSKQHIVRALAVFEQTGQTMSSFMSLPKSGGLQTNWFKIAILPERDVLYKNLETRLDIMLKAGLLDEIETACKKYNLNYKNIPESAGFISLGMLDFIEYLNGVKTLEEAKFDYLKKSRNYAKRQYTWAKTQYKPTFIVENPTDLEGFIKR